MNSLLIASRNAALVNPSFVAISKIFVSKCRVYDGGHYLVLNGTAANGTPIKSFIDVIEGAKSEHCIVLNPTAPKAGDTIGNADAAIFLTQAEYEAELKAAEAQPAQKLKAKSVSTEPAVDF